MDGDFDGWWFWILDSWWRFFRFRRQPKMLPMIPRSRLWLNMCGSKLFKKPLHPSLLGDPRWSAGCIKGWRDICFELKERVGCYLEIFQAESMHGRTGMELSQKIIQKICLFQSWRMSSRKSRFFELVIFFGFVWKASFWSLFQQHFLEELWRNGMERHFLGWALGKRQQESFLEDRLEVPWDEVWISWNSIASSQTPCGNVNADLLIFIWFWYEFFFWIGQKQMANIWGFENFLKVFFRNMVSTLWSMLLRKPSNQKRAKKTGFAIQFPFFGWFSTSPLKWWEFTFLMFLEEIYQPLRKSCRDFALRWTLWRLLLWGCGHWPSGYQRFMNWQNVLGA